MIMPSPRSSVLPDYTPYDSPRAAPRPLPNVPVSAVPASASSDSTRSSQRAMNPPVPARIDPLRVNIDENGHRQLPFVSHNPLHIEHDRVMRLIKYRPVAAQCSNCSEAGTMCDHKEWGIPCSSCAASGCPDCDYNNPYGFVAILHHYRDGYLHAKHNALRTAVESGQLTPSGFDREYENSVAGFYAAAQGAITRFMLNHRATHDLMVRGIYHIIARCTDTAFLTQLLAVMHDKLHPAAIQVILDRLNSIYGSLRD
ncbi:hypothetical protein R3P38DRAFT_2883486 [Favolaschia claudopus]|uniref:Uncharacterized protein n=1 Tax=Favolaschia claudopus TaxID=2862362 RepID=A0AAW0CX90_9AGAR